MFDKFRLKAVLVEYKKDLVPKGWKDESYKWEAVKCFQDNWDVNAEGFADMLHRSLDKTFNLLTSRNNFPREMIENFAKSAPEEVRSMFIKLYDETNDVYDRIKTFKDHSSILLEKYGNGAAQHYQHENAICVYLWLRYPDKYYIYKYSEVKKVADELNCDYDFKKGAYAENIRSFLKLYDEIDEELKLDIELVDLFRSQLTDSCYPDPELRTLTIDVGFYISHYYAQKEAREGWFPADYTPGLTVEDWEELLGDKSVFTDGSLEIMKRMKDYGGQASCKQLSVKYGGSVHFYRGGSVALARRVAKKTGCSLLEQDNDNSRLWPVLYVGKWADEDEEGIYVWKLRDELSQALERVDLSRVQLFVSSGQKEEYHNPKDLQMWDNSAELLLDALNYFLNHKSFEYDDVCTFNQLQENLMKLVKKDE